ncbi:MAG: ROK family transcriptional regulator [Micromonosporaceae bacterium]|nr:ROK family transcriptional regulator [Micromonosporaceae bacterium]
MTAMETPPGYSATRALRPSAKSLPEHARGHNRSLVLQTLYRNGELSRADLARATGLTRVTISDLVADLIAAGLVVELGQRDEARPGKPATLLGINRTGHCIIGLDLSGAQSFLGALLDLDGGVIEHREVLLHDATGPEALECVVDLARQLVAAARTPVLGVGVGSPGIVDRDGVVLTAPNLGWTNVALRDGLAEATGLPVFVANDANAATLAELTFGDPRPRAGRESGAQPSGGEPRGHGERGDLMVVTVGHGVGAGLIIDGRLIVGSGSAAGEIGHVVVGTDGGSECACGKHGCLETWLAAPRLEAAIAADPAARDAVLDEAGRRLGIALAPVVAALNLAEVVLSGPAHLLDGRLLASAVATLRSRTLDELHGDLTLRMSALGKDIVLRGAAAMVLSGRLGVA